MEKNETPTAFRCRGLSFYAILRIAETAENSFFFRANVIRTFVLTGWGEWCFDFAQQTRGKWRVESGKF